MTTFMCLRLSHLVGSLSLVHSLKLNLFQCNLLSLTQCLSPNWLLLLSFFFDLSETYEFFLRYAMTHGTNFNRLFWVTKLFSSLQLISIWWLFVVLCVIVGRYTLMSFRRFRWTVDGWFFLLSLSARVQRRFFYDIFTTHEMNNLTLMDFFMWAQKSSDRCTFNNS